MFKIFRKETPVLKSCYNFVENSPFDHDSTIKKLYEVLLETQNLDYSSFAYTGRERSYLYHPSDALIGFDFSGISLNHTNFSRRDIEDVNFTNTSLIKANFTNTRGYDPKFKNANLEGVDFSDTNLTRGDFSNANLRGANFTGAKLDCIKFYNANLQGAIFIGAILTRAKFKGANLIDTDFRNCTIKDDEFGVGADFTDANLRNAKITNLCLGSKISKTDFLSALNIKITNCS